MMMMYVTNAPYSLYVCLLQICDFGLAKWKRELATQTTTGSRRGTVAYMAPEVFKDVNTPRTVKYDVYSFGILLWELLAGKEPFENGRERLSVCVLHQLRELLYKTSYVKLS